MNAKTIVTLGLVHVLTACMPHPDAWKKEGASDAEWRADNAECRKEMKSPMPVAMAHLYNTCMERKGWKLPEEK
jgi:hypothetical protein